MADWPRTSRLVAAGLAIALFAAGCDSEAADGEATGVLSAEQVGGTVLPSAETQINTSSPCGLDGSDQWVGASDDNTRAFERDVDGLTEEVVIGVTEREPDHAHNALQSLRRHLDSPRCRSGQSDPPTDSWTSEIIPGFDADTIAFRSVVVVGAGDSASEEDAAAEGRHSYLRAYRQSDDRMIFVWLKRDGDSDPSVDDLRELLDEQTELVDHGG